MPRTRLTRLLVPLLGLGVPTAFVAAQAPVPAEVPTVLLRYRELTNRQSFNFVQANQKHTKPVGDMSMEFPAGLLPSAGLDPTLRTFCVEPLVPMYAGEVYPFQVDPLGKPAAFGLSDTPEGVAAGEKRARFVRELYGRFYTDVAADPAVNAPAFQVALWELTQETEVPDGPMPFSLATGTFRADYPNEADSPAFVRQAQRYVQTLTGDDASFAANPALANMQLTRLTALHPVGRVAAGQSQLALRTTPTTPTGFDSGGLGGPAGGGLGGMPTGFGGLGRGIGGGGIGGPAGGRPGGFGGGGGGFGGFGGFGNTTTTPTTTTTPGSITTPGNGGPASPTTSFIPTVPVAPGPDTTPGTSGPSGRPPEFPPGPTPPSVQAVPAPAGLVLAGVAAAALGLRRFRRRAD